MRDPFVTISLVSTQLIVAAAARSRRSPARPWARVSGGSGLGSLDLPRRQVDLRARITQIPLAHAVVQMNDAMHARIVLDRELAELRIDADLVAKPLVELFHLLALFAGHLLGLVELDLRKRRAQMLGGLDLDDPAGSRSTVEKTVMSSK